MTREKLKVYDGEELECLDLPPTQFCIQSLLPQGVSILGGAPKVGKSWLVLNLCICIAKGEPIWNMKTTQGITLYLCLEDTLQRIRERVFSITDEVPSSAFFAVAAQSLADGLCRQIYEFAYEHPDTRLVVIDTFQMVRNGATDVSYANDYQEVQQLKALAVKLGISILLVHHLRKQGDSDPVNRLSGSTGISGAVDGVFVLERSRRSSDDAALICTGRDIPYRELELRFRKDTCTWELVADSMKQPELLLPDELNAMIAFMKSVGSFSGSNTEFANQVSSFSSLSLSPKGLKQLMNKYRSQLLENGVTFQSIRSNGQRTISVQYAPASDRDASDGSDAETVGAKTCDPCVTCDPVGPVVGDLCGFEAKDGSVRT